MMKDGCSICHHPEIAGESYSAILNLLLIPWLIAGDQATYELMTVIRQKDHTFDKVVLLLGGFHLSFNFLRAICKIVHDAGGESLLIEAGHFTEGTAKKAFSSEKSRYYQTLYAVLMLGDTFNAMYMEALASHVYI